MHIDICACYRYVNVRVALHVVMESACPRGERWERKKNTFSSLAAGYSIGVLQLSAFTPLSRRVFFFFSIPSDKTNGPPYTIYSGIFDFIIFQFCLQKVSLQRGVELETRIIRKDIFLLLSFFSSNVQQRFNSFNEFRRQGSDRTYVQFRLRFGRRNGRVHGRHVGAEVMRQLGHVIRAGHSLRYARHARHAGRAGTVGRYARDGGFRCRWRRHRGLRAAVRCQDHGLSYIRDRSKRSDGIFLLSSSIYHPLGTPLHWAEDRH